MGGGGGMHNPFDIFQSFFGGGSPFGGMYVMSEVVTTISLQLLIFLPRDSHSMLFCCEGGGSSRGRRQRRGDDVVHALKVSLDELYNGTSKKLSLSRNVLCSKCNGYVKWLIFSVEPCIYFLLLQVLMLCCIHYTARARSLELHRDVLVAKALAIRSRSGSWDQE
jgi:hypothetical protein